MIKICFIHLKYNSKCTSFRSLAHNSGNDGPKQYNTHKKRWGYCILDCALLQRSLFVCWTAEIRERLSAFHTKPVILNTRLSIYIYIYTYIDTIYFGLQKKKKWTRAPVFLGFLFFSFSFPFSSFFLIFPHFILFFFAFVRWEGVDTHHSRGALSV